MSRQLLDAYRFAQAQGSDAERRWLKSCTPYQRGVLDRALAAEAEMQAHPLPGDPEPVVASSPLVLALAPDLVASFQRARAALDQLLAVFSEPNDMFAPLQFGRQPNPRRSFKDGLRLKRWER